MCNALTVTKRESAPLPERLCEQIAYCAILFTAFRADYSVVVAQSEGADHCYYSTPEMQNISLQNAVGHAVRKAKNTAGGATDAIFSGRSVLNNLTFDAVLEKTKATAKWHRWVLRQIKLEHIANSGVFAVGGKSVTGRKFRWGYSCSLTSPCRDVFQVCGPNFVRLYSFRNVSRTNAHGANLSDSCSCVIFLRRLFRVGDGIFVNFLLFIMASCIAMRRSSSHHGTNSFYPLDSMPRCCNSLRIIRFIQAARESSPSCCCAFSIFSRKSGSKRNWNGGLPRLSPLCVDTSITPHVMYLCVITHYTQSEQKVKPCKCRYHWQGL